MDPHPAAAGHGVPALQRQHDVLSLYGREVPPRGARHRLQVRPGMGFLLLVTPIKPRPH